MDWTNILLLLSYAYSINNLILLVYSLNLFLLLFISLRHWGPRPPTVEFDGAELPSVLVQLPIYNERFVVERAIGAAVALDYPRDRLCVQVLDDSTDDTRLLATSCVEQYRALGFPIEYRHRVNRQGYKAGALAEGMAAATGDFVAIFDADFVPPRDFLRRLIPDFLANPRLGMLQARWDHLNLDQNWITRALGLGLDAFFAVEQVAFSRGSMFMNFNGSAGIWRRACIQASGGWTDDTLVEDTDLSYRAQLDGWLLDYRPEVAVPGQLPDNVLALKLQQFRWSKGATQALRKLWKSILTSNRSLFAKFEGLMQLGGYFSQPLMLFSLILSLPVVLLHGLVPLGWAPLGFASIVPPLVALFGQIRLHRPGLKVWLSYPVLFLYGIGLSISNTQAVIEALLGRESEFKRTPKKALTGPHQRGYRLLRDWTVWAELAMAIYGAVTVYLALQFAPGFAPFILLYTLGFGFTGIAALVQEA